MLTNFEIGRRIVEHEQKGKKRTEYGTELLKVLSARLTEEFGNGFSPVNLSHMRRFFLTWKGRVQIFQKPSEKLISTGIQQKPSVKLAAASIPQTPSGELASVEICQKPSDKLAIAQQSPGQSHKPFTLSWSHYVLLLTIKDPGERNFYEIEAANEGWSLPVDWTRDAEAAR